MEFIECIDSYKADDYEIKSEECSQAALEFGSASARMMEIFSEPPNWDKYISESSET